MSTFFEADPGTADSPCLAASVVLPPPVAQPLCDTAGALVAVLPEHQQLIEAALSYLLRGSTTRRRQRCRCHPTFCLHDAARLIVSRQPGPRK